MKGGFMSTWLGQRIAAINICMGAGFADAALALLYSAVDTLAFLSAPAKVKKAERRYFIDWCNAYMVPFSALGGYRNRSLWRSLRCTSHIQRGVGTGK